MCVFDPTVQESRDVNPLESTRPVEVTAENGHSVRSVLIALAPDDPTCVVLDGRIVLGRSPDCDVVIDAPSVSRRHAALFWEGAVLNVEDLGSANGTYLDARPVRQRALVAAGMTLRLGEWLGGVEEVSAERIEDAKFREILPGVLGGAVLCRVLRPAIAAATSDIPVLLVGATGVGKERVAAAIHQTSGRPGPLHAVNCASIPASLAEAEFFGYVKGAFTGAARANLGHVLAADKGTLFLDEVADLPPGIQPLFLRVLDQREIVPLGQTRARPFDARVVAAAHEPLIHLVERGRFRPDLAARLSGIVVELPPLAGRRLDIPRLFHWLLTLHGQGAHIPKVSPALYERLCTHAWPGNVRELELLARQLLALHGREPVLHRSHLPSGLARSLREQKRSPAPTEALDIDDSTSGQRADLIRALQQAQGNVRQAAQSLGISRYRAYRLLDPYTLRKIRKHRPPK